MKIPTLASVAKKARKRPFCAGRPVFRFVVTVYVDTFERSAERVMQAVQMAVDEVTSTIQRNEDVDFEAATAVGATRTEKA